MLENQFVTALKCYGDVNAASTDLYEVFLKAFDEVADISGLYSNIFGLFFHDLMIHFTGILIQRESAREYEDEISFPWVNREYAFHPYRIDDRYLLVNEKRNRLKTSIRRMKVLPIASGDAVPIGDERYSFQTKLFSLLTTHQEFCKTYLLNYQTQLDYLKEIINQCCNKYHISNSNHISENWQRYVECHTTRNQRVLRNRGLVVGTRALLQNRKLAINYLMQDKPVVGMTHGEITNTVFNEPLFGYAELSLCSTLLDFGDVKCKADLNKPLIEPTTVLKRTSTKVNKIFRQSNDIEKRGLRSSRTIYIPTLYSGNHFYGPYRGFEDDAYKYWQSLLLESFKDITIKAHPKSRRPGFPNETEFRWLEDCVYDYDVLVLDYYSTAATISVFTDKPVIFFDLGFRNLDETFLELLRQRCFYRYIDWSMDISSQIMSAISEYNECETNWSNESLRQYSLCQDDEETLYSVVSRTMY